EPDSPRRAGQTTRDRPSAIDIFLSVSPAKKAIQRPSGEKNGSRTEIASPIICSESASSFLSTRRGAPPTGAATYAIVVPSGETAIWLSGSGKSIPGGRSNESIDSRGSGNVAGFSLDGRQAFSSIADAARTRRSTPVIASHVERARLGAGSACWLR